MADELKPSESESAEPPQERRQDREAPSPGALLRAARLAKKLETKEVAATLNVDPWMLDALEHDEYAALGAPVFAKGHLRKYAAALGIDDSDVLVAYYQREGSREAPPLIAESILRVEAARGRRLGWLAPTFGVLALSLIALVLFMYFQPGETSDTARAATPPVAEAEISGGERSQRLRLPSAAAASDPVAQTAPAPAAATPKQRSAAVPAPAAAVPAPATESTPPARVAEAPTARPEPRRAPRTAPAASAPAASAPATADAPLSPPSQVRVTLDFAGDSWVEIYDAERRKLMYDMGRAGSRRSVAGDGPLQVFLGKASDVSVRVNGEPYTVERITRRGTARFYVDRSAR